MPDVLIGNFKGPQGETGPANKLLATVYQFCESNDGQKIPDGPWLEELPEIQKGKYYWCRNIMTWDEGEDSVLYSVGYVGLDGEFTGTDLLEELKKRVDALETRTTPIDKGGTGSTTLDGAQAKLGITQLRTDMQTADKELDKRIDGINDYTTGINVLRGTMDFRAGLTRVGKIANYFGDGFYTNPKFTKYKDEDGFTVLHAESSDGTTWINAYTSLFEVKQGEQITVSFDYMIDDINSYDLLGNAVSIGNIRFYDAESGSELRYIDFSGDTKIKSKEWKQLVFTPTVPDLSTTGKIYALIRIHLYRNGSINFRKVMAQRGFINHPIYTPNPNDIDYLNDETTGINLLRGTRDFADADQNGITLAATGSSRFYQGFHATPSITKELDSEGFAVAVFSNSSNPSVRTYGHIGAIKTGESITYGFEILYASNMTITGTIRDFAGICDGSQEPAPSIITANHTFTDYGASLDKRNVWQKVKITLVSPSDIENAIFVFNPQFSITAGSIRIRKIYAYKGSIQNPIWSASPFDVASNYGFNALESRAPFALGMPTNIPNNSDLNTYKTPGTYYSSVAQSVSNLSNRPNGHTGSFKLVVEYTNGTNYFVRQTFYDSGGTTYTRRLNDAQNSSAWTDWVNVCGTDFCRTYAGGGTNSNSLSGAKNNLGITALETRVKTLEDQLAALTS